MSIGKIRISAVKYANSYPLIYGLRESELENEVDIAIDHPSECAHKLSTGLADIGLVPVAMLPAIKGAEIISSYCIGTQSPVRTVMLLSNDPVAKIRKVYLDYRSRTSVALIRVIAAKFWNKKIIWKLTDPGFDFTSAGENEGVVIIGDQCFEMEGVYSHSMDLSVEWKKHTGLPFVFAVWAANKKLDPAFINRFNSALDYGIRNIGAAVRKFGETSTMPIDVLVSYLYNNIDYHLDNEKKIAMDTFLNYLSDIK